MQMTIIELNNGHWVEGPYGRKKDRRGRRQEWVEEQQLWICFHSVEEPSGEGRELMVAFLCLQVCLLMGT